MSHFDCLLSQIQNYDSSRTKGGLYLQFLILLQLTLQLIAKTDTWHLEMYASNIFLMPAIVLMNGVQPKN